MNTILVIEDDQFIRDITSQKLNNAGFTVLATETVEQAKEILQSKPVDLIILDLELPGASGIDYLGQLKTDAKSDTPPIIVFSNVDDPDIKQQCLDLGATNFFVKIQSDYNKLIETINETLS